VHNIQRVTPQNQECNNCHGQVELFLTDVDVDPDELEANRDVIVSEVPEAN
jgi:thiosulfate/3-mercaptopyruvate sulfurtransferase